jgi:hypothetical protein
MHSATAADWVQWSVKYIFIRRRHRRPIWLINYLWRAARERILKEARA